MRWRRLWGSWDNRFVAAAAVDCDYFERTRCFGSSACCYSNLSPETTRPATKTSIDTDRLF